MDPLEAFKNKGYISIAEDEEMQIKELQESVEAANAENAILRELLRKNGMDFTV